MKKGSQNIFGTEFVVNGIRYRAIPDKKAGRVARGLYDIFAPFKGKKSSLGKGAEASREGRSLIGRYIYYPLTRNQSSALDYTNRLGTGSESFWSSWFFGNVYKHSPEYRTKQMLKYVGRTLYGYPHVPGIQNRSAIDADPNSFAGQTRYVMFAFDEAPVDIGDNIIAIDRTNPQSFSKFLQKKQQSKSHGRVVADVSWDGKQALLHGGNESGTVGKDWLPLKNRRFRDLDSQGRLIHPGGPNRYTGIMKKVIVLGPDTIGTKLVSASKKFATISLPTAALAFFGYQYYNQRVGSAGVIDFMTEKKRRTPLTWQEAQAYLRSNPRGAYQLVVETFNLDRDVDINGALMKVPKLIEMMNSDRRVDRSVINKFSKTFHTGLIQFQANFM
jgi:hypothetical protein